MHFSLVIRGYGFCLNIGTHDIMSDSQTILAWSLIRRHFIWRGETHTRSRYGYTYRCVKNGEDVENISFRSPIVNNLPCR